MLSSISELKDGIKVIGIKQVMRAVRDGSAVKVFTAYDADQSLVGPLADMCLKNGTCLITGFTMEQLGRACGIDFGAAAAAIVSSLPCKKKARG